MEHINSGRSWSPDLRLFLIQVIKPRERLWSKFGACGQDADARMNLWTEVQEEITKKYGIYVDIDEIKKTWKNLKDNFLRVKKASNGEGYSKPGGKKWFFYDQLQFLLYADVIPDYKLFQSLAPDPETEVASMQPAGKRLRLDDEAQIVVSIPSLEVQMITKQEIPLKALLLTVDSDLSEIAELTAGRWWSSAESCPSNQKNDFPSSSSSSSLAPLITEEKPLAGFATATTTTTEKSFPVKEELLDYIRAAVSSLREQYEGAAGQYAIRRRLSPVARQKLLIDFDSYVYDGLGRTDDMTKVIRQCLRSKQSEFEQVFQLLEQHRSQLSLHPPGGEETDGGAMDTEDPAAGDQQEEEGDLPLSRPAALKRLHSRKEAGERRRISLQREIERINGELGGQPSVIRRTRLRKMLDEAQQELETVQLEREELERAMSDKH